MELKVEYESQFELKFKYEFMNEFEFQFELGLQVLNISIFWFSNLPNPTNPKK